MSTSDAGKAPTNRTLSRRSMLKLSGAAGGGVALMSLAGSAFAADALKSPPGQTQVNTFFTSLKPFHPGEELADGEMRITFLGTSPIPRLAQACNSVFVELGNPEKDCFVFDAGSGVVAKYMAMGIRYAKMDKVFITHLHGDHTSDLTHIYCFGPAADRKAPLYVWGPSASQVEDPTQAGLLYEDGTITFCQRLRELNRWHTEAFSFLPTSYVGFEPPAFDKEGQKNPEGHTDGYDIVPFELNWRLEGGVAYAENGVTITHFPAMHDRQGSISYKLEWEYGGTTLSMIYTGDTKPTTYVIDQATSGVDVLIHEMVVPPEVWAAKNSGLTPADGADWDRALFAAQQIENNSHTPAKALGYILSRLETPPRLAVATHFQATDDTIRPALADIRSWYDEGDVTVASDFLVINVDKDRIRQRRAVVSEYAWQTPAVLRDDLSLATPKYHDEETGLGDPYAQLDPEALANEVIPPEVYDPTAQ